MSMVFPTRCKRMIKRTLVKGKVLRLAQGLMPAGTLILRYHSIRDDPDRYAHSIGRGIIHSTSVFQEQMEHLARWFHPVSLDDVVQFANGECPMPRRAVAITFDDGYADNFHLAAPILDRLGIPATFYVTVNSIGARRPPWFCRLRHAFGTTSKKTWEDAHLGRAWQLEDPGEKQRAFWSAAGNCASRAGHSQEEAIRRIEREMEVEPLAPEENLMMSWDQVRSLHRAGHTVGSHTLTHPNLAHVSAEDASWELAESKRRLEFELDAPVLHFSYPSPILEPHWNEQTMALTRACGYRTATTCMAGAVRKGDPLMYLKRVAVPDQEDEFLWSLESHLLGRRG